MHELMPGYSEALVGVLLACLHLNAATPLVLIPLDVDKIWLQYSLLTISNVNVYISVRSCALPGQLANV